MNSRWLGRRNSKVYEANIGRTPNENISLAVLSMDSSTYLGDLGRL